jgi:hypothetical protein
LEKSSSKKDGTITSDSKYIVDELFMLINVELSSLNKRMELNNVFDVLWIKEVVDKGVLFK